MDTVRSFFYPRGAAVHRRWGYTFCWTPLHKTAEELFPLRNSYDKLSDDVLDRINARRESGKGTRDLYTTLHENHSQDPLLEEFWNQANTIPEWVDWEQIDRGQQIFYRYGVGMITGLGYHSLLGGMGAARITEVLARTGGFSKDVARKRMLETLQHILECTQSVGSIKPGGQGHISSIKVRLLHASVRKRILRLREQHPEYYDLDAYGTPVNDLDSIATILSFSASLIWISLPRQGIFLREQEKTDYLALWRLIAHYVGCPTDAFATAELSKAYMESFLISEVNPSKLSKVLSQNIIFGMAGQPPSFPSADYLVAQARWLNDHDLADALGLPQASLRARLLFMMQCFLVGLFTYVYRTIPYLDRSKISNLRRILYGLVVDGKIGLGGATNFDFHYIPQLDTITEAGMVDTSKRWAAGIERRIMVRSVVMGCTAIFGMWCVVKAVRVAFGV